MIRIKVMTVVAVALGAGFIGSAVLNMIQFQRSRENAKLLQGQIDDFKYQYNLDHASPTPTPDIGADLSTTSPTPTPAPSSSPAVAGATTLTIGDPVNAKLTASDPVADLTYWVAKSGQFPVAALTTVALKNKYPACGSGDTNNALGLIVRKTTTASTGTLIKKMGNFNYFYLAPSGYCASDDDGKAALEAARAAVKNTVLATLAQ